VELKINKFGKNFGPEKKKPGKRCAGDELWSRILSRRRGLGHWSSPHSDILLNILQGGNGGIWKGGERRGDGEKSNQEIEKHLGQTSWNFLDMLKSQGLGRGEKVEKWWY